MADNGIILFTAGVSAGLLGGLLGIGGGIILMPVLRFVIGLSPAESAGTCVLAVFFTTLGGGFRHYRLGHVPMRTLWPVIVSGVLATLIFSFLFLELAQRGRGLDFGIGCVLMFLALFMIGDALRPPLWKIGPSVSEDPMGGSSLPRKAGLGILAGILPGLFGIGTGAILVPGFTWLLKMPIRWAIGSALVCFSANALISALMKYSQGYVLLELALPLGLGCLIGAQLGAMINHRTPPPLLKALFGAFFAWVAFRFMASAIIGTS